MINKLIFFKVNKKLKEKVKEIFQNTEQNHPINKA